MAKIVKIVLNRIKISNNMCKYIMKQLFNTYN